MPASASPPASSTSSVGPADDSGRSLAEAIARGSGEEQFEVLAAEVADEAIVRVDDRVGQGPLVGLELEHLLLDRVARDQPVGEDRAGLADPVGTIDRLGLE